MFFRNDAPDHPDIGGNVNQRPVGTIHQLAVVVHVSHPCFEVLQITAVLPAVFLCGEIAFGKSGEINEHIVVLDCDFRSVDDPRDFRNGQ